MHNGWLRKSIIWLFWLVIWQAAAAIVNNPIIFTGPIGMMQSLLEQMPQAGFWLTIGHSFTKISIGFVGELLEPFMTLIRSIPVASFVILALIWIGSGSLSVFIAYLVVLPMIYVSTISGLKSTDPRLLEMAAIFHIRGIRKIRYIYLPALMPYLASGCKTALGMSWKSGIAAEVIGIPASSIGEQLYYAKLYLDTAGLFAWTFVITVVSAVFEKLFLFLLRRFERKRPDSRPGGNNL